MKAEKTRICPQCKESFKDGATTCPHCRANLIYQGYPNALAGLLIGIICGFVIYYVKHGINYKSEDFLITAVEGIYYALIGGIIGGIIGRILNAFGFNKIKLSIQDNKYIIGGLAIFILGVLLFTFLPFIIPSCNKHTVSLEKERQSYDKQVKKILQKEPKSVEDYKDRGDVYFAKGDTNQAVVEYSKAIEANPNDIEAYVLRAGVYYSKDNFDQAISDYSKAIEINPGLSANYFLRGSIYAIKKEYNKAYVDIIKAKELGQDVSPEFIKNLRKLTQVDISLEGLFVDASGKNSAVINGKVVFEGDSIGGIIIDKINKDTVEIIVGDKKENIGIGKIYSFSKQ